MYNFSLQYHPGITHIGYENKRSDHQLRKFLIVKQILLVSTLKNVLRTVWRICILTLGCKGLRLWRLGSQSHYNVFVIFPLLFTWQQLSKKHHKGRMLKVDWLDRLTFREIEMVNEVRFSLRNLYFIALFSKPIIELESFPFTHKCVRVIGI